MEGAPDFIPQPGAVAGAGADPLEPEGAFRGVEPNGDVRSDPPFSGDPVGEGDQSVQDFPAVFLMMSIGWS